MGIIFWLVVLYAIIRIASDWSATSNLRNQNKRIWEEATKNYKNTMREFEEERRAWERLGDDDK